MLSEFIEIAVIGALFTTLFLGGYNLPWLTNAGFVFPAARWSSSATHGGGDPAGDVPRQVFLLCSFQILIRWTLPRFRWDQLLSFAWKFLLPLSIANLVVTESRSGAPVRCPR